LGNYIGARLGFTLVTSLNLPHQAHKGLFIMKLNLKSKARLAGPDLYKNKEGFTCYKNSDGEELCLLKFPLALDGLKEDGKLVEDEKFFYFEGYASTWSKDLGDDVINVGAFKDSLKQRKPKVLAFHDPDLLAGFSLEEYEDQIGLRVKGRIPKDGGNTPLIVPYMGEGGLDSLSIGFRIARDDEGEPLYDYINGVRYIKKVDLYEYSFVAFPMNPAAKVVLGASDIPPQFISSSIPDVDLPVLSGDDMEEGEKHYDFGEEKESVTNFPIVSSKNWSPAGAVQRIKEFTKSIDTPSKEYAKCFALVNEEDLKSFSSYRIPVCDIVDGSIVVVKESVAFAVSKIEASELKQETKTALLETLAPWVKAISDSEENNLKFDSIRDVEHVLKKDFNFSGKKAKALISEVKRLSGRDDGGNGGGNTRDDITEKDVNELKEALLGKKVTGHKDNVSDDEVKDLIAALNFKK